MDDEIRKARYDFYKLNKVERFYLLVRTNRVSHNAIDLLPNEFFIECFNNALTTGQFDQLANEIEKVTQELRGAKNS